MVKMRSTMQEGYDYGHVDERLLFVYLEGEGTSPSFLSHFPKLSLAWSFRLRLKTDLGVVVVVGVGVGCARLDC